MVALPEFVFAIDVEQDHYIFRVEFLSASFQRPHPVSFLECNVHTFDAPDDHLVSVVGQPEVYDDRVFVYRCVDNTGDTASGATSTQVIDRREGHTSIKTRWSRTAIHAVDRRMVVAIGSNFIAVYAFQEPDRSPQRRIACLCPKLRCSSPSYMYSEGSGPYRPYYRLCATSRSENSYNPNLPDLLIRKPGRLVVTCIILTLLQFTVCLFPRVAWRRFCWNTIGLLSHTSRYSGRLWRLGS